MQQYVLRRIVILFPVLIGVTIFSYLFINLAPGDPVTAFIDPATSGELGPDWVKLRKAQLGLDKPLPVRYVLWLRELARGNLGYSLISGRSVSRTILQRLGPTVLLMGASLLVAILLGIPFGILSAIRQYSLLDYITTVAGFVAISTPSFFLGLGLIYIFAITLRLLPTSGMHTLGVAPTLGDLSAHMVMPVVVLGLGQLPLLMRYARSSMLEVIHQDYVTSARAKGLAERTVLIRHAFRNALIPLITIIGLSLPNLLGGAVIIEQIFQWPGMGLLTIQSVNARDYPLLMGIILVAAIVVVLSNLLADIAYSFADPRIKYR